MYQKFFINLQGFRVARKVVDEMEETTCNIGRTDQFETENGCPICLEKFVGNRPIRVLPCRHRYHSDCVDDWLVKRRRCPLCGYDILRKYKNIWYILKVSIAKLHCLEFKINFLVKFFSNFLKFLFLNCFKTCNFEFVTNTCIFLLF